MTQSAINLAAEATEIPQCSAYRAAPTGLGRAILPPKSSLTREGPMRICLRRREFIAGLGGAAAWPLAVRAQQGQRVRRIGVLIGGLDENDPEGKRRYSALTQALAGLGWSDGRNCADRLSMGGR